MNSHEGLIRIFFMYQLTGNLNKTILLFIFRKRNAQIQIKLFLSASREGCSVGVRSERTLSVHLPNGDLR